MDFGISSILAKEADPQAQSPLFQLAPEIRNLIYSYVFVDEGVVSASHNFRIHHHHDGDPDDDGALDDILDASLQPNARGAVADNAHTYSRSSTPQSGHLEPGPDTFEGSPPRPSSTSGSGGDDANYHIDEEYEPGSEEDTSSQASDEEEEEELEYEPENWGDFNNNIHAADFIERGEDPEVYRASDVERPGGGHTSKIHTSFLRTCRRAYAEAHHQVPDNVVWRAWYYRGPVLTAEQQRNREHPHHVHCLKQARRIHFCTHMFWVKEKFYREVDRNPYSLPQPLPQLNPLFSRVEQFRLTVRGRFWFSDSSQNLWLDPFDCGIQSNPSLFLARSAEFGNDAAPERPDYDWAPPFSFRRLAWGLSFQHMPNLKVLTVDLEISENEKAEMEIIADWATRTWRFPLGPRADGCTYLSTQGNPVQRMSWRGLPNHWPHVGPMCGHEWARLRVENMDCEECARKQRLRDRHLGPRMYVWTLTLTPHIGKPWSFDSQHELRPKSCTV